jgi:dynein heavy chain
LSKLINITQVESIKESALTLSSTLELSQELFEKSLIFQNNWILIGFLFNLDDSNSLLSNLVNRFTIIQKNWYHFIKFCLNNSYLFHVITYPKVIHFFDEIINSSELILNSTGKFFDSKRNTHPRFYFLSNEELLELLSVTDLTIFSTILSRAFMNISSLNLVNENSKDPRSFKLLGFNGYNNELFQFSEQISC